MAELLAGRAFVDLIPRVSPAGAAAAEAQAGTVFSGISSKAKVAGLAVGAAFVGGTIAAGVGLFKLGSDFHDAFARIRVDTGATGDRLDGLEGSFKKVLSVRPDSMDDVALAVSKLNVGLGTTGPQLEDVAIQVLRLSGITKTDLGTNLQAVTTLFNNFGIAAEDQPRKLDELFRASQATGVSVADLASSMASGGSLLRTVGLDFEQSAALLGLLGKSGISTTAVMGPLSKAIATAAKSGKSATDVLRETFDAIRKAPDDTAAAGAAIDTFGARAGPRLAGLIREGKLSYDELAKTIGSGTDTIAKAATDTSTLGGKFAVFRNKIKVALEPLATTIFDKVNDAAAVILPKIGDAVGVAAGAVRQFVTVLTEGDFVGGGPFSEDSDFIANAFKIRDVLIEIGGIAKQLFDLIFKGDFTGGPLEEDSPVVTGALALHDVLVSIWNVIEDNLKPILITLGGILAGLAISSIVSSLIAFAAALFSPVVIIGALVAALIYAYQNFDGFRNVVDSVAAFIVDDLVPVLVELGRIFVDDVVPAIGTVVGFIRDDVLPVLATMVAFFRDEILPVIARFVGFIVEQIGNLVGWWRENWTGISEAVGHVFAVVSTIVKVNLAVIVGIIRSAIFIAQQIWSRFGDTILAVVRGTFGQIAAIIKFAVDVVRGVIELFVALINGDWGAAWDALVGLVEAPLELVQSLISLTLDTIGALFSDGFELIKSIVEDGISAVVGFFVDLPSNLASIGAGLFGFMVEAFVAAKDLVLDHLAELVGFFLGLPPRLVAAVGDLFGFVPSLLAGARDLAAGILGEIVGFFIDLPRRLVDGAGNLFGFISEKISTAKDDVVGAVEDLVKTFIDLPARLAFAAGGMFSFLWDSFKAGLDLVIDAWNNLKIPSFRIGGWDTPLGEVPHWDSPEISFPDIPRLELGGRALMEGLGIIGDRGGHGGELVKMARGATVVPLSRDDILGGARGGARGAGITIEKVELHGDDNRDAYSRLPDELRAAAFLAGV